MHGSGHGLIEVLAALALASAGVIGFLHAQHLREATETELLARTRAAALAGDAARKIAANPGAFDYYRTAFGAPPAPVADCRRRACSRSELAVFHVAHWKCRLGRWTKHEVCDRVFKLRGRLPEGDGRITPRGGGFDVEVRWRGAGENEQSFEAGYALLRR